jgi:hypothetical protein
MYMHVLKQIEVCSMIAPAYLSYSILAGCLGVQAAMLLGLRAAAARDRVPAKGFGTLSWSVSGTLAIWFAVALWLTWAGVFHGYSSRVPTIQFALLAPILLGLWFLRSRPGRHLLSIVPPQWVIAIQVFRVEGAVFLTLLAAHRLPGAFAWPAGVGDVVVGLLAPLVALRYARRSAGSISLAVIWNVLGLLDLIEAVAMGFITSPSPLQMLAFDTPNELITMYPLALVPVYLVPLAVILHVASLAQLRTSHKD